MELELYHLLRCPYSAKVRDHIDRLGIKDDIKFYEIEEEPEALERLEQMTGKTQVPCLVIDGEPMLESDDIIRWLDNNQAVREDKQIQLSP